MPFVAFNHWDYYQVHCTCHNRSSHSCIQLYSMLAQFWSPNIITFFEREQLKKNPVFSYTRLLLYQFRHSDSSLQFQLLPLFSTIYYSKNAHYCHFDTVTRFIIIQLCRIHYKLPTITFAGWRPASGKRNQFSVEGWSSTFQRTQHSTSRSHGEFVARCPKPSRSEMLFSLCWRISFETSCVPQTCVSFHKGVAGPGEIFYLKTLGFIISKNILLPLSPGGWETFWQWSSYKVTNHIFMHIYLYIYPN